MHRYLFFSVGLSLGSFIFGSRVQVVAMVRPTVICFYQFVNFLFWAINMQFQLVENFYVAFVSVVLIGGVMGSVYTNFLYLANAKTDLESDLDLIYYERGLAVNLLLMASDTGFLFGMLFTVLVKF